MLAAASSTVFMSESIDDAVIGPVLPPGYDKNVTDADIEQEPIDLSSNRENAAGETGASTKIDDFRRNEETDSNIIGPVLPNGWKTSSSKSELLDSYTYGPALPPGFSKHSTTQEDCSDQDDDIVGPLPSEAASCSSNYDVISDIERRAKKMRDHLEGKDKQEVTSSTREEWMVQLPEALGHKIGIVSRTFRQHIVKKNEDRSVWTDTPADVERKSKEKPSKKIAPDLKEYAKQERDQQMFEQMEEYNKSKRAESLLEIHRKNRKRKAKEEALSTERRPFDRELDLSVSRCNPSQTTSIIDKAKFLNSRFSHGSSQFL